MFSHQGSYISALNQIAAAAGGYVQPHASTQTLKVLPRYPRAPWDWGAVVPDFELPADVTSRESIQWLEKPAYNRVFVSGQEVGVLAQVSRAGTAGDVFAPMVVDALITQAAAARQRGIAVLADTGRQVELSLRLPVLLDPESSRPVHSWPTGMAVSPDVAWCAAPRCKSACPRSGRRWECKPMHNLYQQFRSLLPHAPLQAGTVAAVAPGVVSVQLPGGGRLNARGQAAVGQNVFVRDGVVEAIAPNLTLELIDI